MSATEAKVLNGSVRVGDRIAYANRSGSWMTMQIARVTEITERDHAWQDRKVPILKVAVEQSSNWNEGHPHPYNTTVGVLKRVVKL